MTYRRLLLAVLAVGLLACLYVAVRRERHEHRANRVEIVMDDQDFQSLARSYAYDQRAFLIALRQAGLTSLAVQEELGGASFDFAERGGVFRDRRCSRKRS